MSRFFFITNQFFLREKTHFPVFVDQSHSIKRRRGNDNLQLLYKEVKGIVPRIQKTNFTHTTSEGCFEGKIGRENPRFNKSPNKIVIHNFIV